MRLKRTEFIEAVKTFEEMYRELELLKDFKNFSDWVDNYYNLFIKMTDCDENGKNLIDYFFFELDFGEASLTKNIIVSIGGEDFKLRNAEDLWVALITLEI